MPRFGDYGPDTVIDGTELLILRSEDGNTRYTTVDTVAEYAVGSPGGGTPPVVIELATETGSFSITQITHAAKYIRCDSASPMTVTIPANSTTAIDVGCVFTFKQQGSGTVTFAPAVGVTVESLGDADAISGQYGVATLVKEATDTWGLSGTLV